MITGLLLAAGSGRRFGGPKLVASLGDRPVIRWSAEALRSAVDDLAVVVPPADAEIRHALAGLDARLVVNPAPERGMATSIACGVAALPPGVAAVVVALADEPGLDPAWVHAVVARHRAGGAAIVAPTFQGERGHPVLFDRTTFPELRRLEGDRGARSVVDADPGRTAFVELGARRAADVDVPDDLARLRRDAQFRRPPPPPKR